VTLRDRQHCAPAARPRPASRCRGIAMLLVLIAVAVCSIMGMAFLSSQSTVLGVASNIDRHARARQIAETGLTATLQYIQQDTSWRTNRSNGAWFSDVAFAGGTYTIRADDGTDTDGDGVIDGDGDLADDPADVVTVTSVGAFQGVTHRVRALVTPGQGLTGPITVLMVVANPESLTALEQSRKTLIESWGWTVALINTASSAGEFTTAMEAAHVVYVPEDGGNASLAAKLLSTTLGIVVEDGDLYAGLGLSSGQSNSTGAVIRIVDTSHYITSPFSIGDMTIAGTGGRVEYPTGTLPAGLRPLAWWPGSELRVVGALEAGKLLRDGSNAAGRRVVAPFAGINAADMTDDGKALLKRMLEWTGQSAMVNDTIIPITNWIKGTTINRVNGEARLLVVAIGAETHQSVTGITYGNQPMALAASAYESTGVGARTYIYYAREAAIAAAADGVVRITWTGSRDAEMIGCRMFKNVNQTDPIRNSHTRTNAGPVTIATDPLAVTNGDMVCSVVMTGNPSNYTWASPLVEGLDEKGSTSGHGVASFAVTGDPGTVTASATCSGPNRQSMVTVTLQPRARSNGEGVIPQILTLYEFDEQQPEIELKGHWNLDDDGSGGAAAVKAKISLSNSAILDGYYSSNGAYAGANTDKPIILVTNTSAGSGISVQNTARLAGSTYNSPGANPSSVVSLASSATITGNRFEQSTAFAFTTPSVPSGMPASEGAKTFGSGTVTLNANKRYSSVNINNPNAVINISGNIKIQCDGTFTMSGGRINIPSGSSLELWVGDTVTISNASEINNDTTAASRLTIYQTPTTKDFNMSQTSVLVGTVWVGRDFKLSNSAQFYGSMYVGEDLTMSSSSGVHIDRSMPGFHIVPVGEVLGEKPALAHGGVTFKQAGARADTNTALAFDGSNDFVLIPHDDDFLLHNATISFWFYSQSLTGDRALLSKDSTGYDTGGHLHVWTTGTTLKARLSTNGSSPYGTGNDFEVSASGMTVNTWRHVTVTLGAGGLRLYVNGSLVSSVTYPGGMGASSGDIGNYQPLVLGAGTLTAGDLTHLPLTTFFQGRLDDLRIYREVLDPTQIQRLYQGQDIGDRTAPSYVVRDTSGLGNPLDLTIENTNGISWVDGGGLILSQATVLRAPASPSKVYNGLTATGEFSVEMTVAPSSLAGARKLLWYGANSGANVNLEVGQSNATRSTRARTTDTSNSPNAITATDAIPISVDQHVLVTYNKTVMRIYHDGVQVGEQALTGTLLNWDMTYKLIVANHPDGTTPWLGTLKRIAIYDRALNTRQVGNVVSGLPPGDGATSGPTGISVRWLEE
jgi:hypothetical protein